MNIFKKAINEAKELDTALTECKTFETGIPNPNYVPPASTKTTNSKTTYALKLYISFEDLDTYVHNHIDSIYEDHTFIPIKAEVNENDLSLDITLMASSPAKYDGRRYKLDLNKLPKEN